MWPPAGKRPASAAIKSHQRIPAQTFWQSPANRAKTRALNPQMETKEMGYKVAVVGATGNVGREMLNILADREFPADEVVALASRRSLGTDCAYGDKTLKTLDLDTYDFTGTDIALFAIGSDATKKYGPKAAAAGAVVIDNSSLYRYDPDVPLIVPEVNPDDIVGYAKKNTIATRTCLLYTSPSPRDLSTSRMPSSA